LEKHEDDEVRNLHPLENVTKSMSQAWITRDHTYVSIETCSF